MLIGDIQDQIKTSQMMQHFNIWFITYYGLILMSGTRGAIGPVLYLNKAGLASRNIVHKFKTFLRCIGLCFFIVFIFLF